MQVLVVEDDRRVADFLVRGLRAEGHTVSVVHTGTDGFERAKSPNDRYDLILLDIMLPGMNGVDVCQNLRSIGIGTPILMLTAMISIEDRVSGLRCGADDYLGKPFAFEELLARMDALTRRGNLQVKPIACSELVIGDLHFNLSTMTVSHGGKAVILTAKELALLELFMRNPDRLYSRERILSNVWGTQEDPLTNVVDVYIARLRSKLSEAHSDSCTETIQTVRGLGYKMTAEKIHKH